MANECVFCGVRRIETNTIVLNGGQMWVEFCGPCGESNVLRNADGVPFLVREIFEHARDIDQPRKAEDIAAAKRIADAENAMVDAEAERDAAEYESWREYEEMLMERHEAEKFSRADATIGYWDNLVYRCENSPKYTAPNFLYPPTYSPC